MRKVFAIGTLLLSSAAVFASPAVTVRGNYNQTVDHGYVAPAPAPVIYGDRVYGDRVYGDRVRNERERVRLERLRLERLRLEREMARLRMLRHYGNRW